MKDRWVANVLYTVSAVQFGQPGYSRPFWIRITNPKAFTAIRMPLSPLPLVGISLHSLTSSFLALTHLVDKWVEHS